MSQLTIAVVKAELRALGLTLHRDVDFDEFQVRFKGEGKDAPATYFTNDLEDALHSALSVRDETLVAAGLNPGGFPTSSRTVNKALMVLGFEQRLVRGRGYWYFVDGGAEGWFSSSVPVYRIDGLSLVGWLNYRDALASDARNL
jgi:hypothetical protein